MMNNIDNDLQKCIDGDIKLSVPLVYEELMFEFFNKLHIYPYYAERVTECGKIYSRIYTRSLPVKYLMKKDIKNIKKKYKQLCITELEKEREEINQRIIDLKTGAL